MITELRITNRKNTPLEWWPKITELARRKVFKFKPGLNIIVGPNGTGKSSILKGIGTLTHCRQGGTPKVTQESLRAFRHSFRKKDDSEYLDGMALVSDGQQVHYFDPDTSPGLFGGMAAFDYDFMGAALGELFGAKNASSGQGTLMRLGRIVEAAQKATGPVKTPDKSHLGATFLEIALRGLKGTIEKGQRTILLDEPDRSLDLLNQVALWTAFVRWSKQVQIIVASHNPLAFGRGSAHYVETVKGS